MIYTHISKNPIKERLSAMYNVVDEGANELTKAEITLELEKGRKPDPIGSRKTWGNQEYVKTASGWKSSKDVKEAHDKIHGEKKEVKTVSKHAVGTEGMYKGDEVKIDSNDGMGNVKFTILDEDGKPTDKWNKVSVHEFDTNFSAFPKEE